MAEASEIKVGTSQASSQNLEFSPKVLAALIASGLVAASSIVFIVYFLATKDNALEPLRTEVEDLKDSKSKLEANISTLTVKNDRLSKSKPGGSKSTGESSIPGGGEGPKQGDGDELELEEKLENASPSLREHFPFCLN